MEPRQKAFTPYAVRLAFPGCTDSDIDAIEHGIVCGGGREVAGGGGVDEEPMALHQIGAPFKIILEPGIEHRPAD